jgi:RND family efflux transporter MFP subunit
MTTREQNRPDTHSKEDRAERATDEERETDSNGKSPAVGHGQDAIPKNLPKFSGKKLAIIGAIVLLVLIIAFFARFIPQRIHERHLDEQADQAANAPPIVNVTLPQPVAVDEDLTLPADVRAMQQTAIYARVDGYMKHWLVDINDRVSKGQLLAEIEAPDTDAELAQSQAALQQALANVVKAASDLKLANDTFDRYHGLLQSGSVTQQDLDTRQSTASQSAANKAAADAAVKSAQATVDRLIAEQGFEKITAPFSGTITFRNYDVGARISSTDTAAGHEMFDIADTDRLRIYVNVPQAYVNSIQVGQPVQFISQRNYGNRPFTGVVARSAGVLDPSTRTLLTELDFENHDHLLWAGMYGEGHISVHTKHPMLTVPTPALMFEANGTQVAVVDDQNHVHFRPVTVGQDLGQKLEVVSGLSTKDRIISNPGEKLLDGIEVEVAGPPEASQPAVANSGDSQPTSRVAKSDSDSPGGGSGGATR